MATREPKVARAKKRLVLVILALGAAFGVFIAVRPWHVKETRSIGISAPATIVYGHVKAMLHEMKWDGVKGKDPQWIESAVEGRRVTCELTDMGFSQAHSIDFSLTPEGEGVRLTSTYEGDARSVDDLLVLAFSKRKIEDLQQHFLDAIKRVSERHRGGE